MDIGVIHGFALSKYFCISSISLIIFLCKSFSYYEISLFFIIQFFIFIIHYFFIENFNIENFYFLRINLKKNYYVFNVITLFLKNLVFCLVRFFLIFSL